MAYTEPVLHRAKAKLARLRQEQEDQLEQQRAEAYAFSPRLQEIDRTLRAQVARAVTLSFRRGVDPRPAVEAIGRENLALQRERETLLRQAGVQDYLDAAPVCPLCGGTGYVGARMCACLRELCRQEQLAELTSLLDGSERFENFQLKYYSARPDAAMGCSPRENAAGVFEGMRAFADSFSEKSGSVLLSGGTGLGKSFLSACVARTAADHGFSVVFEAASAVFAAFEKAKFDVASDERSALTEKYLRCDLLVLDDLGTEMTTRFTQSVLYTVVNTRLTEGRSTILTTNLRMAELAARYMPQIASRIKGEYTYYYMFGEDIRVQRERERAACSR